MKKLIDPEKLKECYTGHNGLDDKASYESIRCMIDIQPNALDLEPLWSLYEKYVRKTVELDAVNTDFSKSADDILEYTSRNGMATGILRCLELLSDNYMEVQKRSFEIYCSVHGHSEFAEGSFPSYQEKQQLTECQNQNNEEFEY